MPLDNAFNLDLIEDLYAKYQQDPQAIDPSWKIYFDNLEHEKAPALVVKNIEGLEEDLRIYNLINAYRTYGHLAAKVNPIATQLPLDPWQLQIETYGFHQQDLSRSFPACGFLSQETAPLKEIVHTLQTIYAGGIGFEYMDLDNLEMEKWIQAQIEPNQCQVQLSIDQKKMILQQLNRSELFELFLHMKYTAQKRFSLEGGETLIPILEAIIESGNKIGISEFIIGMAHRGRLNVLSNILRKSHSEIFSEFEEGYIPNSFEGSGDVKYHKGFSSEIQINGNKAQVFLAPNPSHLEAVDPVVEGLALAKQIQLGGADQQQAVLPVLIHGDAALPGQGVVYETMQFYNIPGYSTGGTIHIVINNQIGFTATAEESRSTRYCTDIAKAFNAPVFHVNAEDPEGCVYAATLAAAIRQKFHCDVFIDMNCYRKYGHNESDEPAFTQPHEYQLIRKRKPIRELYRDSLIQHGVVEKHIAEALEAEFTKGLDQALQSTRNKSEELPKPKKEQGTQDPHNKIETKVSEKVLQEIAKRLSTVPEGFSIHPKLLHLIKERQGMLEEGGKPIDWGMAETLAYGSILWEGIPVRISGQDSCRGTFSHRHASWMDQKVEQAYYPLQHIKEGQGRFDILNSSLSENAVLGFELGYSIGYPNALVIWEAQFGDFCNGAQVIIDQFITTGEQKWGQKSGIVLFLPHGYEGQGPEHSSGRMERFLSLSAQDNIRVVNPTTPAQLFHLLRRQVLSPIKKPLVVFTPKGLLRHPACISTLKDLTEGCFQEILTDKSSLKFARKLILCSGRIYYDLIAEHEKDKQDIAFVRIEQLYPLDVEKIGEIIKSCASMQECLWVQEEPQNMGAWDFIHPILRKISPVDIAYIGRPRSASPAAGSYALHKSQYAAIMNAVFKRS